MLDTVVCRAPWSAPRPLLAIVRPNSEASCTTTFSQMPWARISVTKGCSAALTSPHLVIAPLMTSL